MDKLYLQQVADKRRDILWARSCEIWPKLIKVTKPVMVINNRLKTTGGRAWDENPYKIDLSAELFWEHTQAYISEIIPHEMAHIVDYAINGYRSGQAAAHNHLWEAICVKLRGHTLPRFHRLTNSAHENRKGNKYAGL